MKLSVQTQMRRAALVLALASASNMTNTTNTRYCKCKNVADTDSVGDYKLMCETEASSADVVALSATFKWADQDWGNQKGRFEICRVGASESAGETAVGCWSSAVHIGMPRAMSKAEAVVVPTAPLVANFSAGDRFRVRYVVGAGGGHELYIKRFVMAIERPGAVCDEPRADATKSYCQCAPPKLGGDAAYRRWIGPFRGFVYGISVLVFGFAAYRSGLFHRGLRAALSDNCATRTVAQFRARRAAKVAAIAEHAALFNGSVDLRVHTLAGETKVVRIEPDDKVERVARRIAAQVDGAPPAEQVRLVIVRDGVRRPLDGERRVSECEVLDGTSSRGHGDVHMVAVAAL